MTPAQIADATRTKAARVRRTTRVAASERATAIGARHGLDLLQLSVIAEFDDDDEATKALIVTAVSEPEQATMSPSGCATPEPNAPSATPRSLGCKTVGTPSWTRATRTTRA